MQFPNSYFEDEVREGFFISSMMKRAWAAQLEVLEDIDRLCRKHNIAYYADGGTLLGAVRHRGYIPWDDDLDICMMREDYDRFLAIALDELPEGYHLHNIHTDNNYSEMFTRVLNSVQINFTQEFLEKFHGCPYGMGIDVFAMDYIAPQMEEAEAQLKLIRSVMDLVSEIDSGTLHRRELAERSDWIEKAFHIELDSRIPLRVQLLLLAEKLFTLYDGQEAEEVTTMQLWVKNEKHKLPKSWYQETLILPFETTTIPVPFVYDAVLHQKYGSYMQPVKNGGAHECPFYRKQEEALRRKVGENPYIYIFDETYLYYGDDREITIVKKQVREQLRILEELHERLKSPNNDIANMLSLLTRCQGTAIQLGTLTERIRGQDSPLISKLEEYCELVYQIYTRMEHLSDEQENKNIVQNQAEEADKDIILLEQQFRKIKDEAKKDIVRCEVLFLPYKAAQWNALESVWRAADLDPDCTAYVIPLPYFYKNPDGSPGEGRYEADLFPDYVPVTRYDAYDFETHSPDAIYIQNPYDGYNSAITVHPFFYTGNLKKYTERLVYIPPFVVNEFTTEDRRAIENLRYCCTVPGVVHADKVIVQSEAMRRIYIEILTEFAGEKTRQIWTEKITGLGLSKIDLENTDKEKKTDIQLGFA